MKVEAKAVYSHSGEQDLFVPAGHPPGASLRQTALGAEPFTTLSVPLVALDDYFGENANVTLLKIDVEGAELGVPEGRGTDSAATFPAAGVRMREPPSRAGQRPGCVFLSGRAWLWG